MTQPAAAVAQVVGRAPLAGEAVVAEVGVAAQRPVSAGLAAGLRGRRCRFGGLGRFGRLCKLDGRAHYRGF